MTYVIAQPCVDLKDRGCVEDARSTAYMRVGGGSTSTLTNALTAGL